jgi:hypothetical protein
MKKLAFILTRQFFVLTAAIFAIGFYSCCNNQASSAGAQSDKPASGSAAPTGSSPGELFSATIDGQFYSSGVSTGPENIGLNQVADDKQPYVAVTLGDVKSLDDQKITRGFRMVAAKKTASVHLTQAVEIPNYDIQLDYYDGDFSQFRPEDMQLNITDISDTRVKGNFSGKMYNNSPHGAKKFIMVDGKFDIPVATPPGQ